MCSVRPRFSWITSTPPRGLTAAAQAPISVPLGPARGRRLGETPQRALPQPLAAGADLPSEVVGAVDRLAHALVHVEIAVGREPPGETDAMRSDSLAQH